MSQIYFQPYWSPVIVGHPVTLTRIRQLAHVPLKKNEGPVGVVIIWLIYMGDEQKRMSYLKTDMNIHWYVHAAKKIQS